jgi:hypothetical protein
MTKIEAAERTKARYAFLLAMCMECHETCLDRIPNSLSYKEGLCFRVFLAHDAVTTVFCHNEVLIISMSLMASTDHTAIDGHVLVLAFVRIAYPSTYFAARERSRRRTCG